VSLPRAAFLMRRRAAARRAPAGWRAAIHEPPSSTRSKTDAALDLWKRGAHDTEAENGHAHTGFERRFAIRVGVYVYPQQGGADFARVLQNLRMSMHNDPCGPPLSASSLCATSVTGSPRMPDDRSRRRPCAHRIEADLRSYPVIAAPDDRLGPCLHTDLAV